MKDIIILAIESSCDETACAIVKNGNEILANKVASQIDVHTLMVEWCQKLPAEFILKIFLSLSKKL